MAEVISKDGTRLVYDVSGSGTPLILVGGAMLHRKTPLLVELAKQLSLHFSVINYDRRGRFDSGDTLPYSPERETEDLSALLQAVGGHANAFGISSGAAVVIVAAASGLKFSKIALYEPPYIGWDESKLGSQVEFLDQMQTLLAQNKREAVVKSFLKLIGVPIIIRLVLPLFKFWKEAIAIAHTIPYDLRILGDQQIPDHVVNKVQTPTLVMAGELTQATLREAATQLGQRMPRAQYKELKGQRHDVSAKVLAEALKEFFEIKPA